MQLFSSDEGTHFLPNFEVELQITARYFLTINFHAVFVSFSDLPKPGAIKIIQQDDAVKFNGEYFEYSFKFSLPAGEKNS